MAGHAVGMIEMGLGGNCLTDLGFESGFNVWTLGTVYDSAEIIRGDAWETPYHGSQMLRIGTPALTSGARQNIGLTSVYQDAVICEPSYRFAVNIFTFDWSEYDLFLFELRDLDTGQLLATTQRQAWGPWGDTTFKTSGWRGITVNTAAFIGRRVRWTYSCGGTRDTLYRTWVYIDTAEFSYPTRGINDPYVPPPY